MPRSKKSVNSFVSIPQDLQCNNTQAGVQMFYKICYV